MDEREDDGVVDDDNEDNDDGAVVGTMVGLHVGVTGPGEAQEDVEEEECVDERER